MATLDNIQQAEKQPKGVPLVLAVEDNEDDVFLLRRALHAARINVAIEWAKDASAAMRLLDARAASGQLPNAVILDLKMPGMDGFELLDWIRSRPAFGGVSISILTASNNPTDSARVQRKGGNGYFVKPSAFEKFVHMTQALERQWTATPGKLFQSVVSD